MKRGPSPCRRSPIGAREGGLLAPPHRDHDEGAEGDDGAESSRDCPRPVDPEVEPGAEEQGDRGDVGVDEGPVDVRRQLKLGLQARVEACSEWREVPRPDGPETKLTTGASRPPEVVFSRQ
jgi:hypothetical protein